MTQNPFTQRVVETIRAIPRGTVTSYGAVAALAGNRRAARQVVRVLHTLSAKEGLPWHRVVNREGRISLKPGHGYGQQKERLEREGVVFDAGDRIDLDRFLWRPTEDGCAGE